MISAAAYAQNIPLKATPADKKIQSGRLNDLLRKINKSENKAELLMKYQYLTELIRGSKSSEIGHFIDKLASELSVDETLPEGWCSFRIQQLRCCRTRRTS
jgi:hypothetical protein